MVGQDHGAPCRSDIGSQWIVIRTGVICSDLPVPDTNQAVSIEIEVTVRFSEYEITASLSSQQDVIHMSPYLQKEWIQSRCQHCRKTENCVFIADEILNSNNASSQFSSTIIISESKVVCGLCKDWILVWRWRTCRQERVYCGSNRAEIMHVG